MRLETVGSPYGTSLLNVLPRYHESLQLRWKYPLLNKGPIPKKWYPSPGDSIVVSFL